MVVPLVTAGGLFHLVLNCIAWCEKMWSWSPESEFHIAGQGIAKSHGAK